MREYFAPEDEGEEEEEEVEYEEDDGFDFDNRHEPGPADDGTMWD